MRGVRAAAFALCLVVMGSVALPGAPLQAATVSSSPRAVKATALDGKVIVRWTAPAIHGGKPLNQYRVRAASIGREVTVPATRLSATINNLVNGTAYSFTVSSHSAAGWSKPSAASAKVYPTRPNILLVLTDDQRWDSMDQVPLVNARSWRRYANSFVVEPLCCPSRASTLSGRIPSHTGVDTLFNGAKLNAKKTFATMLRAHGYQTAFAGKYLNGYPFGTQYKPPGWDQFYGLTGSRSYYDYTVIENGKRVEYGSTDSDYSTDVLRNKIIAASRAAHPSRPVLLDFAPDAPHITGFDLPIPARRHIGTCASRDFSLAASFNAYDTVSEPTWMAGQPLRDANAQIEMQRETCETLRGVDEAVMTILKELERQGRPANTYVVYTSDNRVHYGEHRLVGKGDLYDEAIRVPLLVSGPGVKAGTDRRLTSNIDLAPTFLEWARVPPPANFFDGTSFAASALGVAKPGPTGVLLRGCRTFGTPTAFTACGASETDMGKNWGLRTARYKYVEYPNGEKQLFDIVADPLELTNLAPNPAFAATMAALHKKIVALRT